jgi:hypothetical protein
MCLLAPRTAAYNLKVKLWLLLLPLLLVSCNRGAPQTKEAVLQGVMEHLTKNTGLDLTSMDVEITSLSFRGGEADALVSFRPKGSGDPGMQMKYTLESKDAKWAVKGRAESGSSPHSGTPAVPGGELPAGHPPINPPSGQTK